LKYGALFLRVMTRLRNTQAFTLVEVLLVVVIIAILATLAMPVFSTMRAHSQNVVCIGNLRGLHGGLTAYLQDHDMIWPQLPEELEEEEQITQWWMAALKDYEIQERYLTCPADALRNEKKRKHHSFESSYMITTFDELPNTAFKWKQPWAIENWENHGGNKGPNMLFPDGSVHRGVSMLKR
jgi:prepilin-type N-terminal cleavage/methylation domain-containing protein/prepilin-type processing-associated H-X9-DG protein